MMRGDEAGMTLIELVVSISIMIIIVVPITGSIFLVLLNDAGTQTRLDTANDKQKVSGVFSTDVQSSDAVYVNTGAVDRISSALPTECRISKPGAISNI